MGPNRTKNGAKIESKWAKMELKWDQKVTEKGLKGDHKGNSKGPKKDPNGTKSIKQMRTEERHLLTSFQ